MPITEWGGVGREDPARHGKSLSGLSSLAGDPNCIWLLSSKKECEYASASMLFHVPLCVCVSDVLSVVGWSKGWVLSWQNKIQSDHRSRLSAYNSPLPLPYWTLASGLCLHWVLLSLSNEAQMLELEVNGSDCDTIINFNFIIFWHELD